MAAIAGERPLNSLAGVRAWRPPAAAIEVGAGWAVTRLAIFAGVYFAGLLAASLGHAARPGWDHWDTSWYLSIAQGGYQTARSVNFFPIYPALVGGLARVFTWGAVPPRGLLLAAALVISNLATLAALAGLAAWISRDEDRPTALAAVRLLLAYPLAFFLAAGYADGPFLAASVLALFAARRRRWGWAALAALVAGGLRPTAPILLLPLAWELFRGDAGGRPPRGAELARGLSALLAVPAALAAYGAFAWIRFGDPLLFFHTQVTFWHHRLLAPWSTVGLAAEHLAAGRVGMLPLDLGLLAAFTLLTAAMVGRMRPSLVLYSAGLLLLVLTSPVPGQTDVIASTGRYLLAAFPAFWLLGRWCARHPRLEPPLLATGLLLQGSLLVLFSLGGPAF